MHLRKYTTKGGSVSLFFCGFFGGPSLRGDSTPPPANRRSPEEHESQLALHQMDPQTLPFKKHTHTKSFWRELHHHGNRAHTEKERPWHSWSVATKERVGKGRVVQLNSTDLGEEKMGSDQEEEEQGHGVCVSRTPGSKSVKQMQ